MIKLTHVSKKYDSFVALNDINIKIGSGEFIAIVGPSGSGKSTLMHIIGLLDSPTRGKVEIEGKDISKLNDNKLSKLRSEFVGFVFQQFNLINKLTILENVMLPSIYFKDKTTDFKAKAMALLKRFGIESKADSYPNKISGGQQQRVAIARSLILSPKLILADEPTGNLDTKTGNQILDLLKQLNKEDGVTVVIVTHEPDVAAMCKRQIIVRDGMIA